MDKTRQYGLTLIELLVAMLIGILLLGSAIGVFITNKHVYTEQDIMGRLQENAQFALNALISDIRMAGYMGCVDQITGIDNLAANDALAGGDGTGPNGSDSITVRYLAETGVTLAVGMTDNINMTVTAVGGTDAAADGTLVITDCAGGALFNATVTNNAGNNDTIAAAGAGVGRSYGQGAEIARYVDVTYSIGGGPVLNRTDNTVGNPVPLVSGVESMQILYGVDDNNPATPLQYGTAGAVANWNNVAAVKLALLFQSQAYGTLPPDAAMYNLLGVQFNAPGDQRRRRVFVSTVAVRNFN